MKQFKEISLGCFLWSLDFCGIRENKLRSLAFLLLQSRVIICVEKNYYMLLIVNKIERELLQYKLV